MTREKAINVIENVKFQFQASLDEVDVDKDCKEAEEDNTEIVNALEMAIQALTQEPKIGLWIKTPLIETAQTYSHECSVCGRKILATDIGLSEFPYCHCGAKMVEPQESEDKE